MWQIIKAEYLHTFTNLNIMIIPYSFLYLLLFYTSDMKSEILVFFIFVGGMILSLHDDNRFYLFTNLPVSNKRIAFIRLIMLTINFTVLLIFVVPTIIIIQTEWIENITRLFTLIGILLLIRLFSFSLFDITSGFLLKKRKYYLASFLLFGVLILVIYAYVLTIYFRKYQMTDIFIVISFFLVPVLSFISIKTFLAKERITVKEK